MSNDLTDGTTTVPCSACHTSVLIYPPEDGDGTVMCGRCAGNAVAVVRPPGRRTRNRETRKAFEANRQAGLRLRHRAKLARGDSTSYRCPRCETELALADLLEHLASHYDREDT